MSHSNFFKFCFANLQCNAIYLIDVMDLRKKPATVCGKPKEFGHDFRNTVFRV